MGWVVGWSIVNRFNLVSQIRDAIGLIVVLNNFAKVGRKYIEYNINGCMSDMLVSGKIFSITKYVMYDDIDDIQDPRYYMRRQVFFSPVNNVLCTFGFVWAWMALRARNASPSGGASYTSQRTCHGPRSGPKFAYWVRADSLCAAEPRARGKTRGRKRKKCLRVK